MRDRIHAPYIDIPHYQHLARVPDEEVAKELGCAVRTYKEKISGYYDFSASELCVMAQLFNVSIDKLLVVV